MVTLYGIANCDTVKKARRWMDEHGIEYRFHDFKRESLPVYELRRWMTIVGSSVLLNTRGTTWRKIEADQRASVTDDASAERLMTQWPSVIKRPVVDWGRDLITVGFDPKEFSSLALRD